MKKPNFFIVGKQKSGTTVLYDMLKQHPQVFMPERKETGFFSKDISKKKAILEKKEYLKLFKNAEKEKAIGEATAIYLNSEISAEKIRKFNSNAKIIILLREPLEFIMSLYQHTNYRNKKFNSLEQALKNKEFLDKLRYSKQIQRFLNNFPNKNIKIIIFEDFKKNNLKIYKEICEFLEVNNNFKPVLSQRNVRKIIRKNIFSRLLLKLPLYKMYKFVEKKFPQKIKNLVLKIGNKIVFKSEKWKIDENFRKQLKKRFKPEVIKVNELLHRENLIDKNKNLIKYWEYDEI